MNSKNSEKWYNASKDEIDGLENMQTWGVVRPKSGVIPIDSKWVYKIKYTPTGEVENLNTKHVWLFEEICNAQDLTLEKCFHP